MGTAYSKHWIEPTYVFCASSFLYNIIYAIAYKRNITLPPFNRLEFASTVISNINVLCLLFGVPVALYYERLWEVPVITDGRSIKKTLNVWTVFTTYFIVDMSWELVLWAIHRNTDNAFKLRKAILAHHVFAGSLLFLMQVPDPKYFWWPFMVFSIMEGSTFFLNLQYFVKFYGLSKRHRALSKLLFVISWFVLRVPSALYGLWWLIHYWRRIMDASLIKGSLVAFIMIFNGLMQGTWSLLLIKHVIAYYRKSRGVHFH